MFGGMSGFGWVGAKQSTPDGIVQAGTDDDMHIEDSLGRKSPAGAPVAVVQQVGVELLESLGA
jgi:hypothetical protein